MENCIYRFLNKDNEIIYIGKAKKLKQRLKAHKHLPKECYKEIASIEFACFESECEIDIAERYLIPKYKPRYNVAMNNKAINLNISEFDNINWINLHEYYNKLNEQKKKKLKYKHKKSIESELKDIELKNTGLINDKIICAYTGVMFENIAHLYEYVITKCTMQELIDKCNGELRSKRINFNYPKYPKHSLNPMFLHKYNSLESEEIKFYKDIQKRLNRKVYCITTNELFDNIVKANYKYKVRSSVSFCCSGMSRYCGTLDNKPLVWAWYDDYLNMNPYDIAERMNKALITYNKKNNNKKVK